MLRGEDALVYAARVGEPVTMSGVLIVAPARARELLECAAPSDRLSLLNDVVVRVTERQAAA